MEEFPSLPSPILKSKSINPEEKFKIILQTLGKLGLQLPKGEWGEGAKLFAVFVKLYLTENHTLRDSPIKDLLMIGDGKEAKLISQLLVGLLTPKQLYHLVLDYIDLQINTASKETLFRTDSNVNQLFILLLKILGGIYLRQSVLLNKNKQTSQLEPVRWFFAINDTLEQLPLSLQQILQVLYKELRKIVNLESARNTTIQIFMFNIMAPLLIEEGVVANDCNILKQLYTADSMNMFLENYLQKANIDVSLIQLDQYIKAREKFFAILVNPIDIEAKNFNDIEHELEKRKICLDLALQMEEQAKQIMYSDGEMLESMKMPRKKEPQKLKDKQAKASFSFSNLPGLSFITKLGKTNSQSAEVNKTRENRSYTEEYIPESTTRPHFPRKLSATEPQPSELPRFLIRDNPKKIVQSTEKRQDEDVGIGEAKINQLPNQ